MTKTAALSKVVDNNPDRIRKSSPEFFRTKLVTFLYVGRFYFRILSGRRPDEPILYDIRTVRTKVREDKQSNELKEDSFKPIGKYNLDKDTIKLSLTLSTREFIFLGHALSMLKMEVYKKQ